MEVWDYQEIKEREDHLVFRDLLEYLVPGDQWVRRVVLGPLAHVDLKENRVHRDQQQEEQFTLAGGGPPVPVTRELNWSIQEELEDHATIRVEQPIFSVYLMIQNTPIMAVESLATLHCMEQNIKQSQVNHLEVITATTYHVQCVMSPSETQY